MRPRIALPVPIPTEPAGDTPAPAAAFSALARAHQRAAYGYAHALLRDAGAAEDAVQDALVDAFLHFDQLADRAAFGAWLRRIVFKHCDRQRRRRRERSGGPDETPVDDAAPEVRAVQREDAARVRRAVEGLSEPERVVVALHYFAGEPIARIADFLGLQEGTVKKRLFAARERLRRNEHELREAAAPPPQLAARVELFLAIRAGDVDRTRRLLVERPELLEAEERWSDDEALRGGFSLAHRLTPLILAAGYGDLATVELLLERGAGPDGRCGCTNAETALWAASRAGHDDVAARLRAAGADPAATNRSGMTSEDLAVWRLGLVTPAAHAAHFGVDAQDRWQTGIRALDLWLPLRRGDTVRVVGAAETGLMVLLGELAAWAGLAGGRTVWTGWETRPWQRRELEMVTVQSGVDPHVDVVTAREPTDDAVLDFALARCRELRAHARPVVHVVFEQEQLAAAVDTAWPRFRDAADLTLVVRPWAAVTRGDADVPKDAGPHDAVLCTDPGLAAEGIYPAIDPLRTRSRHGDDPVAAAARELIASGAAPRAQRLLSYLAQPFVTAMPDTGWTGFAVPRDETHADVRRILAGELDDVAPADLRYVRRLP